MYSAAAMKMDGAAEPRVQTIHGTGLLGTDVTDGFELQDRFSGVTQVVSPEVRLQLAVLEDAVDRISKLRQVQLQRGLNVKEAEELREAEVWVRDDSVDWPYAFEACCQSAGLDVTAMRARLLVPGFTIAKRVRKNTVGTRTHTQQIRRRTS